MAKQIGPIRLRRTLQNLTFYQMKGKDYVRQKSSLDGKRVKTDPAYATTMKYAGWCGRASKLTPPLYYSLTKEERKGLWRPMHSKAYELLRNGLSAEAVVLELTRIYLTTEPLQQPAVIPKPSYWYIKITDQKVKSLVDQLSAATTVIRKILRENPMPSGTLCSPAHAPSAIDSA